MPDKNTSLDFIREAIQLIQTYQHIDQYVLKESLDYAFKMAEYMRHFNTSTSLAECRQMTPNSFI